MLCSSVQSSLRCPAIDKGGDNSVPAAGTGGISGQSGPDAVLPVFGRHRGEAPGHRSLTCGGHFLIDLDEEVGGLGSILEGDNEAMALVPSSEETHQYMKSSVALMSSSLASLLTHQ